MVDIGTSDKITNLWPSPPSRPVEKFGHKKKSKKDQNQNQHKQQHDGNEPGSNIDEFA